MFEIPSPSSSSTGATTLELDDLADDLEMLLPHAYPKPCGALTLIFPKDWGFIRLADKYEVCPMRVVPAWCLNDFL